MTADTQKGLLIVLSGPSGCGKGTVVKELLSQREDTVLSVSVTTREPRIGEQEGVHYYYRSREQVEQMIQNNELLEYAQYSGNYYGTPRFAVEALLNQGKNVILEIEVQGARQVMQRVEDCVSVFLTVPSFVELEHRLRGRGTETEERVIARLAAAKEELAAVNCYQYVVLNDDVSCAVERIQHIIEAEKLRVSRGNTIMEEYCYVKTQ